MRRVFGLSLVLAAICSEAAVTWTDAARLSGRGDTLWLGDAAAGLDSLRFCGVDVCVAMDKAATGHRSAGWWQVEWSGGGYARVDFDFSGFVDGIDEPEACVTVCGRKFYVRSALDFNGAPNTLGLEWSAGELRVFAGSSHRVTGIGVVAADAPRGPVAVTASAQADVIAAGMEAEAVPQLLTGWTPEEVEAYFRNGSCPVPQGVWEYLDRDTDAAKAVPGGRYRLAVVPATDADAYDIIYLGGAVTNASQWQPGMRKGRLTAVGFDGHYLLEWSDALMVPMDAGCYAEIPSANVLTFNFPLWSAALRFRRVTP